MNVRIFLLDFVRRLPRNAIQNLGWLLIGYGGAAAILMGFVGALIALVVKAG